MRMSRSTGVAIVAAAALQWCIGSPLGAQSSPSRSLPIFEVDPAWTEAIIAASLPVYTSGILSPKLAEFLSIAVDASITHMYAPGTRRHIQAALKLGATMEEIMEVLKICVSQGLQASNLGVPILAEEIARRSAKDKQPKKKARP